MTKRAVSLAIALILPIILLCGCTSAEQNKRLSPEEYRTAMESAWDKYLNSMLDLIDLIPLEVDEESVKTLQENAESAEGYGMPGNGVYLYYLTLIVFNVFADTGAETDSANKRRKSAHHMYGA